MLILNGKPRRYEYLVVRLCDVFGRKVHGSIVGVDDEVYRNAQVSQSTEIQNNLQKKEMGAAFAACG
jgi:hypothetical protein